jgi:NAD(P)H-dependent FMN reductase
VPPVSIIGISGSTRRGSFNSALLRAAASSLPEYNNSLAGVTKNAIPLRDPL